jgi:hypothetical protein
MGGKRAPFRWKLLIAYAVLVNVPVSSTVDAAPHEIAESHLQQALPQGSLRVPDDYTSIQAAIDAAPDGGTVLVAPGVYHEAVRISGKSVKLVSRFLLTRDPDDIQRTVLDGSIHPDPDLEDDIDPVRPEVILVEDSAGPETTILGLTIRDGDDGIACNAKVRILYNRFVNNTDAIDYEGGGGECRFNYFVANDDDAVDFDEESAGLVANNEIRENDDDGIEIRLHPYRGKSLKIVIRDNLITGNGEDGIQIIDYPELSDRQITIERNVIINNAMSGIGFMANANTRENYEGAPVPEAVAIVNNTIRGNQYGISGGANAHVINNIICDHQYAPLKNVAGRSVISHNLLWANGEKPIASSLNSGQIIEADPLLARDHRPANLSASVDAGTIHVEMAESPWELAPNSFRGQAPDLGAIEIE